MNIICVCELLHLVWWLVLTGSHHRYNKFFAPFKCLVATLTNSFTIHVFSLFKTNTANLNYLSIHMHIFVQERSHLKRVELLHMQKINNNEIADALTRNGC